MIRGAVRAALSGSRVEYELSLPDDLWLANVDEGQIGQVFRNLALNAREAMPAGGQISVRAQNVVVRANGDTSLPGGEYVRISFSDGGSGIAAEVLPKIFDPYYSTKQRGTERGMGLGLTTCHAVVQKHGGAISVESTSGVGTTFQIHLPACRRLLLGAAAPAMGTPTRAGRILVMDDEESVRDVVARLLPRMGHEAELVAEGGKAVEAYAAALRLGRPFDAVLLDLTIRTGMGGKETMEALRRLDREVRGIVMSGYTVDPALLEPGPHGFQDVLTKPFDSESLREALARVMAKGNGLEVSKPQRDVTSWAMAANRGPGTELRSRRTAAAMLVEPQLHGTGLGTGTPNGRRPGTGRGPG